jgi:hypothetical protein
MPVETGRIKHGLAHDVSDCRNFGYPFALLVAFGSPYPADRMAAHRRLNQRRDDLCAVALRKRAFFLVATVTGIALERFDALTRDNRNHENCGYSRFHASIRCHRIRSARKRACTKLAPAQRS